jgi:hypothetical protein
VNQRKFLPERFVRIPLPDHRVVYMTELDYARFSNNLNMLIESLQSARSIDEVPEGGKLISYSGRRQWKEFFS